MRSKMRFLASKDNILSVVAVALSTLVLAVDFFGEGLDINILFEAILVVLILISISQVLERESRFRALDSQLVDVKEAVGKTQCVAFLHSEDVTPFAESMADSDELFYTGGHLRSLVQTSNVEHFEKWLEEGKSIKLILQDPELDGYDSLTMPCRDFVADEYRDDIRRSLRQLLELRDRMAGKRLGVRVSRITPTQSVAIFDGNTGGRSIHMLHHLPNGDWVTAPFSKLDPRNDQHWFDLFYARYYRYLWSESRIIIAHPDDDD